MELLKAQGQMGAVSAQEAVQALTARQLAADPTVLPLEANGGNRRQGFSVLHCNTEPQGNTARYLVRRLKLDAPASS